MDWLAIKYGHYLSAFVQVVFYYLASKYIIENYIELDSASANAIIQVVLVVVPLALSKYFETKYAARYIN